MSVIVPVDEAQLVGLVELLPPITGVGLTTTVVALLDEQLPSVAVTV